MNSSIISTPRTHKTDFKFWLMSVIASTAAILISAGVLIGLIFIASSISPSINGDRLAGTIMLPITATILGVCQWFVLRSRIPKAGWWIPATIAGVVGEMFLLICVDYVFSHIIGREWNRGLALELLTYVFIGFFLALAQLTILRRHFRGAALWLLVSVISWLVLGLIIGVSIDRTMDVIAVGAIPAIFTGFGLTWLMRNPSIEANQSLTSNNTTI
jgi:hypothetical protein